MKKNKLGAKILKDKLLLEAKDVNGCNEWWGDTYRMVKEGYRHFWLKSAPRIFKEKYNIKVSGVETYGEWHPEVRTIFALKKMIALGNYQRIEKIKAAKQLRQQLNDNQ